jgi:hypothetical protein
MQGIAVAMSLMRQLLNQSRRLNASQRQGDVIVILRHTYSLSAAEAVRRNNARSGLQRQSLFNNSAAEAHFTQIEHRGLARCHRRDRLIEADFDTVFIQRGNGAGISVWR